MGFKKLVRGFASTCMGFKRYHLKTHTNSNESSHKSLKTHASCKREHTPSQNKLLKPMRIAAKDAPRPQNISQYRLKPMCIAATTLKTTNGGGAAAGGELSVCSPSIRKHLPRTHTASPRHARTNRNRNQFPGYGG